MPIRPATKPTTSPLSGAACPGDLGLLTRDVALWEKLHDSPKGATTGNPSRDHDAGDDRPPAATVRKVMTRPT